MGSQNRVRMLSKIVCAALVGAAAVQGHSLHTRDTSLYASSRDSTYGSPQAPSYNAPSPSYSAPAPSYAAPSYSAPSYEEPAGLDLTSIIIPLLALIGLSLLFPTFVTLTTVRRKRSAMDEDVDPMTDMLERVNDIYMAVVESEECMERIACEVGGLAGDFGLKENTLAKAAEPFVPMKYKNFYKQFTSGKDCQKIKCGN